MNNQQRSNHYEQGDIEQEGREVALDTNEIVDGVSQAEVNQQIATAKKFPRFISQFRKDLREMATTSIEVAEQCTYVLPARKGGNGKSITGPSVRFAEMVVACYGHVRSAARVAEVGDEYITAVGACWDVQRNNAIQFEVMRRITTREGERYGADMIAVTGTAACSIALRNAIFKVVPQALWKDVHEHTKVVARGDEKSLNERRNRMFAEFAGLTPSVSKAQIFDLLEVKGDSDITLDQMAELAGILTAIRDGDATVEATFDIQGHRPNGARGGAPNEFTRQHPQGGNTQQTPQAANNAKPPQQIEGRALPAPAARQEQQAQPVQQQPAQAQQPAQQAQPQQQAQPDPEQTKEAEHAQARQREFEDWYADRKADIRDCKSRADVDELLEVVAPELDEKRADEFRALCDVHIEGIFQQALTMVAEAKFARDVTPIRETIIPKLDAARGKLLEKACDERARAILAATARPGRQSGGKR